MREKGRYYPYGISLISKREFRTPKEESPDKKMIALCMAALMSLALLAGCSSADPNNPYGQEPAPANGSSTSSVLVDEQL